MLCKVLRNDRVPGLNLRKGAVVDVPDAWAVDLVASGTLRPVKVDVAEKHTNLDRLGILTNLPAGSRLLVKLPPGATHGPTETT